MGLEQHLKAGSELWFQVEDGAGEAGLGSWGDLKINLGMGSRFEGRLRVLRHTKACTDQSSQGGRGSSEGPPSTTFLCGHAPFGVVTGADWAVARCCHVGAGSVVPCNGDIYFKICISIYKYMAMYNMYTCKYIELYVHVHIYIELYV